MWRFPAFENGANSIRRDFRYTPVNEIHHAHRDQHAGNQDESEAVEVLKPPGAAFGDDQTCKQRSNSPRDLLQGRVHGHEGATAARLPNG
jgi:hypothetical protein